MTPALGLESCQEALALSRLGSDSWGTSFTLMGHIL